MSYLLDNAMKNTKNIIIDLGCIEHKETQKAYNLLLDFGIGSKNFQLFYYDRLIVKIPKTKIEKVIEKFPIIEGSNYWQTTHYWDYKKESKNENNNT